MKARIVLLLAALAAVPVAVIGMAEATPPMGMGTEVLARGTTADEHMLAVRGTLPNRLARAWRGTYKTPWDVTALRVTVPPGAHSGWHRHPGPGFMVVTQGAITVYANDCTKKTYSRGQAFMEVPGLVNLVRNEGSEPAMMVAAFVVPSTASLRIDVPVEPCNA
jgi:quercetin dioxygenase-like cupin family protein